MRDLLQVLRDEDSLHWKAVARAWGVDLGAAGRDPLSHLVQAMLDPDRVRLQFRRLSAHAQEALARLRQSGGRMPLMRFGRDYGEIREMGLARREREQPWLAPISIAETLWYAGWLGKGFAVSRGGPEEFVFIPGDLLALMPAPTLASAGGTAFDIFTLGRKEEPAYCGTSLAEDACTLLAFLRINPQSDAPPAAWKHREDLARHLLLPPALRMLVHLLREMSALRSDGLRIDPQPAAAYLGLSAQEAQLRLIQLWRQSESWNDLAEWGEVETRGRSWPNDPLAARSNLIGMLEQIPGRGWVTLASFIRALRDQQPEFMRPAAAFEGWSLIDRSTGAELNGWEAWERVEGAFARWLVCGPLFWLGLTELAGGTPAHAVRLSPLGEAALDLPRSTPSETLPPRPVPVRMRNEGTVSLPAGTDLTHRYQLARCLSWVGRQGTAFIYRLDPQGLEAARRQGLEMRHVIAALERAARRPLPPGLAKALASWVKDGARVVARQLRVVTFKDADTARRAARLSGMAAIPRETLGPQAWVVRPEHLGRVRLLLAENGLLMDVEGE